MEKKSSYNKRKELLYTPYVNGVTNEDGEQVIRPLSEEEKEFLNKFNNEFVNASFNGDESDLHHSLIKANEKQVKKLKKQLKKISLQIRKVDNGYREMNGEERTSYKEYRKTLFIKKNEIKEELLKLDYKKAIEANNYSRGVDVSNSKRTLEIGDFPTASFVFTDDENTNIKTTSESELFDRLKNAPIVED